MLERNEVSKTIKLSHSNFKIADFNRIYLRRQSFIALRIQRLKVLNENLFKLYPYSANLFYESKRKVFEFSEFGHLKNPRYKVSSRKHITKRKFS